MASKRRTADNIARLMGNRPKGTSPIRAVRCGPWNAHDPVRVNVPPSSRISAVLAKPTWSVRSLLPPTTNDGEASDVGPDLTSQITREKLHHLLNLSALPVPESEEEESKLLADLHNHLHFVRAIQSIDTRGVEPLRAIRDETLEGVRESTIHLDDLQEVFDQEEVVGKFGRIEPKRRSVETDTPVAARETHEETLTAAGERRRSIQSSEMTQQDLKWMAAGPADDNTDQSMDGAERQTPNDIPGRMWRGYFVVKQSTTSTPVDGMK